MKTRIALTLMFLWLAGCQPESEVDKCVDAFLESQCRQDNWGQKGAFKSKNECKEFNNRISGYDYRLQCLRAQAGKE
jgi:hypothetical protein